MSRILIVDDEPQILRMLRTSLMSSGYDVVTASNGMEGFDAFEKHHPDLIITDMSMPVMDGLGLTEEVRRLSKVPIIVLSVRATEPVKVNALDAGADDYVTKPFNIPELLARVRAQLRRASETTAPPQAHISLGDFDVDQATHTAVIRGENVHLTPKEFDLLMTFLQHPDQVMTHKMLARAVWGSSSEGQSENLRVLIGQLRKKIETPTARYIQSEPWVGYRLSPTA
ncbi:MAG TPA: response regulator transcription factor [Terriglobus sp.]